MTLEKALTYIADDELVVTFRTDEARAVTTVVGDHGFDVARRQIGGFGDHPHARFRALTAYDSAGEMKIAAALRGGER